MGLQPYREMARAKEFQWSGESCLARASGSLGPSARADIMTGKRGTNSARRASKGVPQFAPIFTVYARPCHQGSRTTTARRRRPAPPRSRQRTPHRRREWRSDGSPCAEAIGLAAKEAHVVASGLPRIASRGRTTLNSVNSPGCVSTSIDPACCLTTMS
jgi:hypothetical protein